MRTIGIVILAAAIIALLLFVHHQPIGSITVFRDGQHLVTRASSFYVAAPGIACRTTTAFDHIATGTTTTHNEIPVRVRFRYAVPKTLPIDWPRGSWCTSLEQRVQSAVRRASSQLTVTEFLDRRREAGDRIAQAIEGDLRVSGVRIGNVSVRIDLPPGFDRVRPIPQITSLTQPANPVIFVGLDGGDWHLLDDYIAAGRMPNLARLVREGSSGIVTTEHPPLSAILWTTMMTGVSPLEHQVLDFTQFDLVTGKKEPITSAERKAPAIWNMETMAGKSVAVFGLWATYPAEPVHGLLASDRLFTFLYSEASPPPGAVYPSSRESWARAGMAAAETAINFNVMQQYLPWLSAADYESLIHEADPYSKPPSALRRMLVETEIYRRLSLDLLSGSVPDLTIIYIQGTDIVGHVFAPYAPPKQREITDSDYEKYHQVPEKYFQSVDRFLGELIQIADRAHATIFIASDHGFHWKEDRPLDISSVANATAAKWHRNDGIYVLHGAGIPPSNAHSGRGTIRQICSTLLAASGMPSGERVAGPPLPPLEARKETVDYRHYFQPFAPREAAAANGGADESLAKLRALGYIGAGESVAAPANVAGKSTKTAGAYNNEGLILKHEGRTPEAIAAFERAMTLDTKLSSAPWNLSDLLFSRKENLERSDALLIRAIANGLPEAPRYAIERAIYYQRGGHVDRSAKLLEDAVEARTDDSDLRMFRGRYRIDGNDCRGALEDFVTVQRMRPDYAVAWASAGLAEICLGNRPEAEAFIRHSLELDPNQPKLRQFLVR